MEAEVHGEGFAQATERDESGGDGDTAEGDLCGEEEIADGPAVAGGGGGAAAFDGVIGIGAEDLAERHQSEEDAGEYGDEEGDEDQRRLRQDEKLDGVSGDRMPTGKAGEGHPSQAAGASAAEDGDKEGFDEDLAKDAPAAGADGQADGEFASAVGGAGGEEAAEIGAGGEKDDSGKHHDASEKAARGPADEVTEKTGAGEIEGEAVFFFGILLGDVGDEGVHFGLRAWRGDAFFEAYDGEDVFVGAGVEPAEAVERGFVGHGDEEVGLGNFFGAVEAFGGDADDGVGMFVDADGFADDVRVGGEITFPGGEGEDGGFRGAWMIVIGAIEEAAEEGLDADDFEVLPADFGAPDGAGDAVGFEAKVLDFEGGDGGEGGVGVADVAHFRVGNHRASVLGLKGHDTLGVRDIELAKD